MPRSSSLQGGEADLGIVLLHRLVDGEKNPTQRRLAEPTGLHHLALETGGAGERGLVRLGGAHQ